MLTYSDAIDHLVDFMGGAADDREQRLIRRAVQLAYRDITERTHWKYYMAKSRVFLVAPYSTGTIAYTNSTLTVTLSGGTFPSWAAEGEILIDGICHKVATRVSGTSLILDATNNPGADISAGDTYTLFRSSYVLPTDFMEMFRPMGEQNRWYNWYISPSEYLRLERQVHSFGDPVYWTIMGDNTANRYGRMAIFTYPIPSTARTHDFMYWRRARGIRRTGTAEATSYTGTCSGTGGTSTITTSGATLSSDMVGAVIRIADNTTTVPDGLGSLTPFLEEHVITAASTNTITIADTLASTVPSSTKFRISDPLDIEPVMYTVVLRAAEYHLRVLKNDAPQLVGEAKSLYDESLRVGLENDLRHPLNARSAADLELAGPPAGINYTVTP